MDANVPVEPGKIFVGGISWNTREEGLKQYFEKFGEVTDCVIMRDPTQDRSISKHRGFGFVTFKDPQVIPQLLTVSHMLDDKKIDPKPAQIKSATTSSTATAGPVKKIFIGGVAHGTSEEDVRQYFSRYGTVTDVDLKVDRASQRMRGFGFVGFELEDTVEQMVQTRYHQINGKTVEVKKAEPRNTTASARSFGMQLSSVSGGPYGGYHQNYGQEYRGTNNQQFNQAYYSGNGHFGYGYGQQGSGFNYQGGYGQYSSAPTNFGYDGRNAYPQSQTSTTERTDTSSSYYSNPYAGHNAQQVTSYPQGDSSYAPARSSYGAAPEGFQQSGGYDYNRGGTTQQRGYGTGGPPYVR